MQRLCGTEATVESEIYRLSGLSALEYESERASVAKKFNVRASTLDKFVGDLKKGEEEKRVTGRSIELYEPELWHEPVNGAEVLLEAFSHIERHMIINKADIYACVLWAVHAHVYKLFSHTPRLIITAPDAECGKTLLMTHMVGNLVNKPLPIENMKPAPFFRLVELCKPTFLIDEGDVFLSTDSDLLSGFNNGWEPHGGVIRCIGDDFEPRLFSTHCPVALAGIELQKKLPNTTISRSVVISLDRATGSEMSEHNIYNSKRHKKGLLETGRKIARWCNDNRLAIHNCEPNLPEGVRNRLADKWKPLFAIAEVASGDWVDYATQSIKGQVDLSEPSKALQLLTDIKEVIDSTGNIHTEILIYRLSVLEDSPWKEYNFREHDLDRKRITSRQIANLLKKYKLEPKTVKVNGKNLKGYSRHELESVWKRYINNTPLTEKTSDTPQKKVTGLPFNDSKGYSDIKKVTPQFEVTHRKPLKAKPRNESNPVTHKNTTNTEKGVNHHG